MTGGWSAPPVHRCCREIREAISPVVDILGHGRCQFRTGGGSDPAAAFRNAGSILGRDWVIARQRMVPALCSRQPLRDFRPFVSRAAFLPFTEHRDLVDLGGGALRRLVRTPSAKRPHCQKPRPASPRRELRWPR